MLLKKNDDFCLSETSQCHFGVTRENKVRELINLSLKLVRYFKVRGAKLTFTGGWVAVYHLKLANLNDALGSISI